MKTRYKQMVLGFALSVSAVTLAHAQDKNVKIGVLTDMSGLYSDIGGPGSVAAAKMAVEDFGLHEEGLEDRDRLRRPPEQAGHRRRNIARQWFDPDKVDVIVDVPTSSVALAVTQIAKEKNKVFIELRRRRRPT